MTVHPIEAESYQILRERVDLSHLEPGPAAVVARVIHATADLDYARSLVVDQAAVEAGIAALAGGAPVVTDVEMVRAGLVGTQASCFMAEATASPGDDLTRSAAAMGLAAQRHPAGALVVVGCAPTALAELVSLARAGAFAPALVIALPVGFVGAAEAKEQARACGLFPVISNVGEKGGSAAAAAAFNAIRRLVPLRAPEGR